MTQAESAERMGTIRTFIAVELDEDVKEGLLDLQNRLRDRLSPRSVRWVQPEGIHLTLKFLGDTPEEKVDNVKTALAQAVDGVTPFTFSVRGLGCFPNLHRPRVVWVGLQEAGGTLARLQKAVEREVAPLGFPTEKRAFSPHLTLGRVQRYASNSEVREVGEVVSSIQLGPVGEMTVEAVSYIKSDLRPSGAVYTTLYEARLLEG